VDLPQKKFEMIIDVNLKYAFLECFDDNQVQRVEHEIFSYIVEAEVVETLINENKKLSFSEF
jgi:hypothetical protein